MCSHRRPPDRYRHLPDVLHIVAATGGGCDQYIERLGKLDGYRGDVFALSPTLDPLRAGAAIIRALPRGATLARQADIVHVHGEVAAIATVPFLRRGPSVITTHGLHLLRRLGGAQLRAARQAFGAAVGRASRTICTSMTELEELRDLLSRSEPSRLALIRNGVEIPPRDRPDRDAVRSELGLSEDDVAVLYLGRLEPRKHPLSAVRAANAVRADAAVVLLVAGDGPMREQVSREAGDAARLLGFRRDVDRLLQAADVFVMPSAREGTSLALLEAMAHGLPAVVSDGPGNPEAVGETGVVVPFGDDRALAAALERLAGEPSTRASLGALARERVARNFSLASFLAATKRVYEEALAGRPN
jgi:glycosyltransferase involved in cell wall biosynthesis